MEISYGLDSPEAEEAFREFVSEMSVSAFEGEDADRAATIRKALDDGEPVGTLDSMIAATALNRKQKVVTRNVSHFDRVEGLTVSPY